MDRLIEGFTRFSREVHPRQSALYSRLARDGQRPEALVISCSDSRVMPEIILQCDPGDIFVTRNAGNIVPPHGNETAGAVASAIEYAVLGLGVRRIIVCGHTDCGAMKALLRPDALARMPAVAAWLGHCGCMRGGFVCDEGESEQAAARRLAMRNVAAQIANLETHPSVAAGVADKTLELHGWLFEIATGEVLALDADTAEFTPLVANGNARVDSLVAAA